MVNPSSADLSSTSSMEFGDNNGMMGDPHAMNDQSVLTRFGDTFQQILINSVSEHLTTTQKVLSLALKFFIVLPYTHEF